MSDERGKFFHHRITELFTNNTMRFGRSRRLNCYNHRVKVTLVISFCKGDVDEGICELIR